MKRQPFIYRDPVEQAKRRFMEADDPWSKERYRLEYERLIKPPVERLIENAQHELSHKGVSVRDFDRAQRKASMYKPLGE